MTEIETTIPGRRITAGPTELRIENTNTGGMIWARLLNDDAKKVADALDPDRGKGTYPSGSQADEMARAIDRLTAERGQALANARAAEAKVRELEHAIEQAARAIRRTREFQAGAAFGVPVDAYEDYALGVARALAEAGLLAPAPLREVTTAEELDALITMRGTVVLDCDGTAWQSCSQCSPLWPDANIWMSAITSAYNSRTSDVLGQVAPLTVLYVPADAVNRAEGDGRAER